MARAFPNRANYIRFDHVQAIRDEIARAIPLYRGIEKLFTKGDQIQWGGPTLYADGRFPTDSGKARFVPVRLRLETTIERSHPVRPRPNHLSSPHFLVSTRRGKQFNSMIQREIDPLTGAGRDAVFVNADDLRRLSLQDGQRVRLTSADGFFDGRLRQAAIKPGNLEVHWPEGNTLLSATAIDPDSMEPDYNAVVTIEAI